MREDTIDSYLLQETRDEGDWVEVFQGYTTFHHNVKKETSRTGVSIILPPRMTDAWKCAGGLTPIKTERGGNFEGRFIGVTLKFHMYNIGGNL